MPESCLKLFIFLLAVVHLGAPQRAVITDISQKQIKEIGEYTHLNCTVKTDGAYKVWWNKRKLERTTESFPISIDDQLTINDPRFKIVHDQASSTYSLQISNLESSDTGIYECLIFISFDERPSSSVELFVRHPPIVSEKLSTKVAQVAEHQPVNLECYADGYPRPTITWTREYNALMPGGGHKITGNLLKIPSARKEDRGTYYCMAENDVGKSNPKTVTLEVEFAPVISIPRPKVAQALDYDIELKCRVEAYPPASIVWLRHGHPLQSSEEYKISNLATVDQVTTSSLMIRGLESDQFGDYFCQARNSKGQAESRIHLFESLLPVLSLV
ncbi:lachesin-like [Phlebotomus argentipes]|uniref:lachesin-like n=1 Tax=Phlebotomus argentipes TaxID=94469 RepID=UPI0028935B7E|nr:lachesin-like [Phlebotomus argentipes]